MKNLKTRTVVILFAAVFIWMVWTTICNNRAGGQEVCSERLSKHEQMELTIECIKDAKATLYFAKDVGGAYQKQAAITLGYFQYRTGMVTTTGGNE